MSDDDDDSRTATIKLVAAALDAILTELVAYRLSRPASSEPIRLRKIPQSSDQKRQALISKVVEDPFEGAMLFALRGIGEELFKCGGTRLMRTVLAEVAAFDAENESRRISPADAQWDGIGDDEDMWMA
jgi:hypothetical protein